MKMYGRDHSLAIHMAEMTIGGKIRSYCGKYLNENSSKLTWFVTKTTCQTCEKWMKQQGLKLQPEPREAYSIDEMDYGGRDSLQLHQFRKPTMGLPVKYEGSDICVGDVIPVVSPDGKIVATKMRE